MGAYKAIKSVTIVKAYTEYDNPETGEKKTLILNETIWMYNKMEQNLVKPNQLHSCRITVQDNPFSNA